MSYNTRRNTNQNYGPPVSSVGQRRPQTGLGNFISGGQLNRNQNQQGGRLYQQHPPQQSQQHHQQQQNKPQPSQQVGKQPVKQPLPQQTKAPNPQVKTETQSPAQQQPPQQQLSQKPQPQQTSKPPQTTPSQQPQPIPQPTPQPAAQQAPQQAPQQAAQQAPQPAPSPSPQQQETQSNMQKSAEQLVAQQMETVDSVPSSANDSPIEGSDANGENAGSGAKKPFWMKRTGRISKAEKMRKRNHRLRKMLQPKNALMVLNELVGSTAYNVSEVKCGFDDMFKATVTIEDIDHVGTGKSKVSAKTAAAETAIRAIVLKKLNTMSQNQGNNVPMEEDTDVKMEEQETAAEEAEQVSWSHIASFAIHKLFSSWDEDGNMPDIFTRSNSPGNGNMDGATQKSGSLNNLQTPEQKPAKKLPENALHMNPIMLLNQMHPTAKYEEVSKVGNPPHIQFTVRCNVMDQSFCGIGPNKKAARKQAAFDACSSILGLQYPPEILNEAPKKGTPMQTSETYTPY